MDLHQFFKDFQEAQTPPHSGQRKNVKANKETRGFLK